MPWPEPSVGKHLRCTILICLGNPQLLARVAVVVCSSVVHEQKTVERGLSEGSHASDNRAFAPMCVGSAAHFVHLHPILDRGRAYWKSLIQADAQVPAGE